MTELVPENLKSMVPVKGYVAYTNESPYTMEPARLDRFLMEASASPSSSPTPRTKNE